jgi:hypothetical protein
MELLMIAADANPGRETSAPRTRPTRRQLGAGADGYVPALKAELAITEVQSQVWAAFAETLSANSHRMQRTDDEDQPFGLIEDRLTALGSMRRAAGELFRVLRAEQRCKAVHLLPLCCLPLSA